MSQLTYNTTSNRLFSSRIIKFALIGILALLLVKGVNLYLYHWVTNLIISGAFEDANISEGILLKILSMVDVGIVGGISTIVTAVIARYGLRESTGNIGSGMQASKTPVEQSNPESAM